MEETNSCEGLFFRKRMWQGRVDHYALLHQDVGARISSAISPCSEGEWLHTEKGACKLFGISVCEKKTEQMTASDCKRRMCTHTGAGR